MSLGPTFNAAAVDLPVCMLKKLPQMNTLLLSSNPVMG